MTHTVHRHHHRSFGREFGEMVETATVSKNSLNNDITVNVQERRKKGEKVKRPGFERKEDVVLTNLEAVFPNSPTAILFEERKKR